MAEPKSRYQLEFEALPEWAQKMVRAAGSLASYGGGHSDALIGMSAEAQKKYTVFHVALRNEAYAEWFDGFCDLRELAAALTAPWPPQPPPERERRAFNLVEAIGGFDDEEGGGFDQPCCFGNRVGSHAVYCHNKDWPDSPRKCRRDRDDYKHEDCPGFVANPDFATQE